MSFAVFTDGSANLPKKLLDGITLLPCDYTINGVPATYAGDVDSFDAHVFYEGLKSGDVVKTSLLNTHLFLTHFTPLLEAGTDVMYLSMSSGISGTYNAAVAAAKELMEEFPDRFVHIVDSMGCGFGTGILVMKAARLSREGMSCREASKIIDDAVPHACQYFTVDDLNFLKKTGRVSGVTAAIGTVLNIKPILYGDSTGHIVACSKVRGRKNAINAIADKFREKHIETDDDIVCISHGDCLDEAKTLAGIVSQIAPKARIEICQHEPFSGAHVGPGMLALFFWGKER
ncbi:MAG: DegV family protein [Butyrivibrio sp.]|nr:DegV family protein [Butyrivibrio sp.]